MSKSAKNEKKIIITQEMVAKGPLSHDELHFILGGTEGIFYFHYPMTLHEYASQRFNSKLNSNINYIVLADNHNKYNYDLSLVGDEKPIKIIDGKVLIEFTCDYMCYT